MCVKREHGRVYNKILSMVISDKITDELLVPSNLSIFYIMINLSLYDKKLGENVWETEKVREVS